MSGATDREWLAESAMLEPGGGLADAAAQSPVYSSDTQSRRADAQPRLEDQGAYRLQMLLSPAEGAPEALYFGSGSHFSTSNQGALVVPRGGRLEGDTFFNAFFLDYWRKWTGITRVGIHCRASGSLRLCLVGHRADGTRRTVATWTLAGADASSVRWIWQEGSAPRLVRLSLEAEALDATSIAEIAFVTDRAPLRPVRVSVGIVTHEREALFHPTVRALAELGATMPELGRVHVVNHGRRFRDAGLVHLLETPLFQVVEQPNLGGCGGFARAMIEALDAQVRSTHLLLMDDDILLDARIIARAVAFAAHALSEVAIGGQAIELERPTLLQEAWGRLGQDWLPLMEGGDLDLSAPGALRLWDRCPEAHYNGWWFNMIPIGAVRDFGLPAPVFLRGDDIEYGLRLRAAGVPTVPLPGLGVWHASVRYKHVGLVQYYDLRNGLITASAHPEFAPPKSSLAVLGWVLHHLLVHRYRAAEASLRAVSDFLDGPDVALWPNGAQRHRELISNIRSLPAPERRAGEDVVGLRQTEAFDVARSKPITTAFVMWAVVRILFGRVSRRIDLLQIGAPDPRAIRGDPYYLALDPTGNRCLEMVPHKGLFLTLLIRALWIALRYRVMQKRAAQRWRDRMPSLRSRDRWAQEFGSGTGQG